MTEILGSASQRLVLVLAVLFVFSVGLSAQEGIKIYFPTGDASLHRGYLSNVRAFAELDSLLSLRGEVYVDSVLIVSKSSPEGAYSLNQSLARRRAQAMYDYVAAAHPELIGRIKLRPEGESWSDFRAAVLVDSQISADAKARLLDVIDSGSSPDVKKATLKSFPEYRHILNDLFPAFRQSAVVLHFDQAAYFTEARDLLSLDVPIEDLAIELPVEAIVLNERAIIVEKLPVPRRGAARSKNMLLALKTNLIYDALTVLNVEVEIPLGRHFSVMWEDVFPWWETGNKFCLQMWEMGPELRYWFRPWNPKGTDKLQGFFVGAYRMSSKYDFQFDTQLNYQGEYVSTGISAGYAQTLSQLFGWKTRARLELSLAVGHLSTDYRHYLPTDSYDMLIRDKYNVGTASYFGPTKAKVSLVIPICISTK